MSQKVNLGSTLNQKKTPIKVNDRANIHKPMSFISSRNKDLGIGILEVLCEKSPLGVKKQYVFRNKRANNLETF